ncbi:hypothetical protein [Methylobacterium sp. R2-1]|uniref:hypothetical protein n=1 Tax=Methylobacterium sp. R2-1 TaxID=2587064 RepID=UPI0016160F4A|nr:hypothetical protein [Methylobacterium sp. R2-1]MBB2960863.1 hypothetical protein [Methylobacterium sp. R2-1]
MYTLRHDLDGLRLASPDSPDVWLVFGGRRHRVASPAVYQALFAGADDLVFSEDIPAIMMGPELNDGTCLVRPTGSHAIFLVTGRTPVWKYHIPTFESFTDFGFNESAVIDVPALLMEAVELGGELTSTFDRTRSAQDSIQVPMQASTTEG